MPLSRMQVGIRGFNIPRLENDLVDAPKLQLHNNNVVLLFSYIIISTYKKREDVLIHSIIAVSNKERKLP